MKFIIRLTLAVLLFGLLLYSHSDYHLKRNENNKLPKGKLSKIEEKVYQDENGFIWEIQPHSKNIFHQPSEKFNEFNNAYSILEDAPKFDSDHPYLKLLCVHENGSSFEAIVKPDNRYLTTGSKQGTFNYASPIGFWGSLKHTFLDVIPHFICSDYE